MNHSVSTPVKKEVVSVNLLQLGVEFGVIIAIPLILFILGGLFLDKTLQTTPLFILLGVFVSMLTSGVMLYKKISLVFRTLKK